VITSDAEGFRRQLLNGSASPITYAGERDADVLAQDKVIASWPIDVKAEDVTVLPIQQVPE